MPRSCVAKCCICIFSPFILLYHAIRIYLCGCLGIYFETLWQHFARCCCACWSCLCCACCGCSAQYTDKKFPPNDSSLGVTKHMGTEWIRLDEILNGRGKKGAHKTSNEPKPDKKRVQLFEDGITPSDVSQGSLGDCWLMSSIAAIAEFPAVIQNLFITKRYSTYGKYTLQLYDGVKGKWEEVVIDNFIPCGPGGKPLFASAQSEMWVTLLEKAVAKFCGSFQALDGGSTSWALHTLVGGPTFVMSRESDNGNLVASNWQRMNLNCLGGEDRRRINYTVTDERYGLEDLFYILREYDEKKAIMCCSSGAGSDTQTNMQGIVLGHAYTLIGVKKVDKFLLLQVRNPWGGGEWTGPWSDNSDMWQKHSHVKKEVNYVNADDGAFWISIEDFVQNFRSVSICSRDTGFNDLALDPHEDLGCCGVCVGCFCGCASYWCCCKGCKALCCAEEATDETVKGRRDGCCSCCPNM